MSRARTEDAAEAARPHLDPHPRPRTHDDLLRRYRAARATTLALSAPLSPEDCAVQSMPDASPVKWHLAHTTWFFETFVLLAGAPGYEVFRPDYGYLFNSYYEALGERHPRPRRGLLTRPALEEVHAYRRHVDAQIEKMIREAPLPGAAAGVLELGIQHEQQHQELILTDVKHLLSRNPILPAYRDDPMPEQSGATLRWIPFEAGLRSIGAEASGFSFDNERPRHRVFAEAFEIATRLVTNAEYAAFVEDGGYERPELWLSDGWDAARANGWRAPLYWMKRDGRWVEFTLDGPRSLRADEPVCHVSQYEADACARWSGARLPSEAEWEIAAAAAASVEGNALANFVESGRLHPAPAPTTGGLTQMLGDVWEWTGSAYLPYPGYRPLEGALGEYNGKFMSGQMVLRGGSCVTPRAHIRATYRNFFPPAARWQFTGIRLARDPR